MKLNPQQAPLYGECVLTIQLDEDDGLRSAEREEEDAEEEVEFYLIFSGSTQRHVSSTLRVSHVTLQAVCPAHNVCEQVLVTLCLARPGGPVDTHSQETFCFVQDLALDMAHFLLDSTSPEEALLLDDEQIPLKECEKLDESLALALKHLNLAQRRTAPGTPLHAQTDVKRHKDDQTQNVTHTDTHTHHTETCQETVTVVSPWDSCSVVSECQQLSNLLQLAASHGLKTVASFLLQQPGGKEALRRTNTRGQTPACLAKARGHQQLVELFTQYERLSDVKVEAEEKLHFYPEGRVFQHHASLCTYTLTFLGLLQTEREAQADSSLQEEVEELRRLIQLHRDTEKRREFSPTHVSTDKEVVSPTGDLQETRHDAGLAVVTIDNCSTTTEEQGSAPSLVERTEGEDSAVVTLTSCAGGRLCQNQEAGKEQKGTTAANSRAGRNKKNKKRTTKTTRHAAESPGCNRSPPEASRGNAQRQAKATGSGAVSLRDPVVASVIGDRDLAENQCSPRTQETPLPISPVSELGGDGKCVDRKAVALPTTSIVEKQEGEKREVELLMCERVVETQIEQGDSQNLPARHAVESATQRTVTMGQEQSQDPKESQSDPEEPSQPDSMNKCAQSCRPKSPDLETKPRRVLWRDGGWIGNRMGSSPYGPEIAGKSVWYQSEDLDQGANEDSNRREVNSQSVWYDSDTVDERKHEQLEQGMREQRKCDLSSAQDPGLSSPQLFDWGLSSHQRSAALSQPHAAGAQPALSHGPDAQRREVDGSQREEEVRSDWKEGGVEGGREEVSNRETTSSRKSSETADIEEAGDEKTGSEEKGAKGRKKRRKKRGKRGGAEVKLSSSSSIESQSQIEVQAPRDQVTALTDKPGRPDVQSPTAAEPTQTEEADEDTITLPGLKEVQTRDTHGPDSEVAVFTPPELSQTEPMRTDLTEVQTSQTKTEQLSEDGSVNFHGPGDCNLDSTIVASELSESKNVDTEEISTMQPIATEALDPTELESKWPASSPQQTVADVDSNVLSENEDLTVVGGATAAVNQLTDGSSLVEFPEGNTLRSVDSDKPVCSGDPTGGAAGFVEPVAPTEAASPPFEDGADVSPLHIWEGSTKTTAREYLEHCFASEMLRDPQHEEEKRNELWVGEEEVGKEKDGKSEENDSRMVHGKKVCCMGGGKQVEDEQLPSLDREKEQKYNEDLVATAVAVVTVAIASAMASVELSQRLADSHWGNQESASSKAANGSPSAQDTIIASDASSQLANGQCTQLSAQLMNKDNCQPKAIIQAETENQPVMQPHIELTNQISSTEQADVNMSDCVEVQCMTEAEKLAAAAQLSSKDQAELDPPALADSSSLPQFEKDGSETESTQNKLFTCSLAKEEDSPVMAHANEMITPEVDSCGLMQTDIFLYEESQLPCPVVDTGQDPMLSGTHCLHSVSEENPTHGEHLKDQAVCQAEGGESHFQKHDSDSGDGGSCVESTPSESEIRGQGHSKGEKGLSDILDSDYQAKEHESHPQQVSTKPEEEIPTLRLSCGSSLPDTPSDSACEADLIPEKPTAIVNIETEEISSSQTSATTKPVASLNLETSSGTNHRKGHDGVAVDREDGVFGLDTVDGWKERERKKMETGGGKESLTVEDPSHTEAELFPSHKEDEKELDITQSLQIQRDTDVFFPAQSSIEHSSVTPCTDTHPDRGECVSVCLLQSDTKVNDTLKIGAGLDDSVFKKPEVPPPCVRHRDRQVCVSWSSSDDASMQGTFSPSEGASSVVTPDTVAPQSSRLSWKSETEDRGGGETEGAGDEEEKKDHLPENLVSSAILRASIRSLSPFRRHSWEPGRSNTTANTDITQRSSLRSLSGEVKRPKPPLHRRSMSWCPSNLHCPDQEQIDNRSYSLEGLEVERAAVQTQCSSLSDQERAVGRSSRLDSQEKGSLVSLTEEEQEGDGSSINSQPSHQALSVTTSCPAMFHHQTLTKSISMVTISHRDIDVSGYPRSKRRISFSLSISPLLPKTRRFFSIGSSSSEEEEEEGGRASSFSSKSGSLGYSISEEEPSPLLRTDTEGKGGPKISRTFSYLRSKMTKKGKDKDKERRGESKRESKEKEKKNAGGHVFIPVSPPPSTACQHCTKPLHNKETFLCSNCGVHVHKSCMESLSVCSKSKTKQQSLVAEAAPGSAVNMRSKSTSSASSLSSTSSSSSRERWSTATTPDDQLPVMFPRRHPSIFNPHSNLSKSISTSNIAGLDDVPLKGLKFLSQSTDSLHQGSKVNASTESLTDEGTEMMDSQLMGEFECDIKDLEADSWSGMVDKKFLKTLKKDEVKRQDVIYELFQTEFHHVRTLKIMSEVYYKGLQKEVQLDTQTLDKIFPVLDELVEMHTHFLTVLLERRRASAAEGQNCNSFLICGVGAVLVNQFSGCSSDRMKKVYGKFCSRHNEAVNLYKDLHAKDKRFQAFIKRIMSSSIVRRLSIPECILLVTQRITKYPVLIQRMLQHTKDSDDDHTSVSEALRCVKEVIVAVDSKVNEQEKKRKLREVYSRTDSKSIMRMKSGQMFAKEDLIRGRKLVHDGALQLKNSAGRLKEVHAMLLSDVLIFLQEKDQKYVFASLDQRSTVISLQNLIVREVANEERGLFLITAGIERPEMVEVLASSKEERNTWRAIIQEAMHSMEKDEDEGVPSETEEDRRQQENRAKEIRELLRRKDDQIVSLLEEKVSIFRELCDCSPASDDTNPPIRERMLFRATPDDVTKGEPIMNDALRELETLHTLVSSGVGGAGCSVPVDLMGGSVGPVCLPRRAETFGGFDSHQMNSSKNGEKEEGDESLDLRRTESDSVLKKGATASLQMLLKRNNEQVQHSVTQLNDLLISLQAVVVQQDSFIEDQRQALNDRLATNSSRHSSSSSLSSSSSSRPSSLIEQEKHRSLERQRQEAATLQKQQAAHQEEKRKREREWELKEKALADREERLREDEEETRRRRQELTEETETLQRRKEDYQRELESLREAQRRLERDKETLRRDAERLDTRRDQSEPFQRYQRTPSSTSEDSLRFHSSGSLDLDSKEAAEPTKEVELSSSAPTKEPFLRIGSKRMGKNFNPFSSSSSSSSSSKPQGAEKESQLPTRLLQLAKPKEKKDKKKKKGKTGEQTENKVTVMLDPQSEGDIFFC